MYTLSLAELFTAWLALGAQSWGGGSATLLMIQREVVERRGWMRAEEFTQAWAICQIAPGINLLGLTILIGWRLRRAPGAAVAILGLLLPSVSLTALLTAIYASIREQPLAEAALRGVVPATVGLGAILSWQLGCPLLRDSRREGPGSLAVSLALLIGSGAAVLLWHPPVILILLGSGALGAITEVLKRLRH
ncbi:chromate transporter [Oscillochloris sp. ZM17-4]|uniref:chromate transporter n=1 Tax=Oscillochloris sp. ZM17-4 TaxID=2866714 RepID=UPI001C736A58|nr:chromate transporter [Oscillochloris sp. ZM17-4]MBX0326172.1 chromate transporter [Oscillochloris sp. ZM17-4]